jgi:lambda family phage minor tail protein L
MAYSAWASSTAYSVGNIVRASTLQASGLVFRCTTAGTSGGSEPTWGTDIGSTITDGTVVWTAVASSYEELAEIAPSAIIELFEMTLDATLHGSSDTYRWHNGTNADVTGNIVWNGNTYTRLPIQADGFDYTNTGSLPRPTLTVSNLDSTMTTLLILVNATTAGNDLGGATVKRIRTLKKYLDGEAAADPHAKFPDEVWYVDRKASENRDAVSFELASKFDLAGVMLPKRQLIANVCQWKYRGAECGYTGTRYFNTNDGVESTLANDVCGKRLASCELRFGQVTTTGTVTNGSDQLVLSSSFNIEAGDPIAGFAVPASTTVSSVSGNTVTMSANANASTTVSVSGTLQSPDTSKIVLSSVAGLKVGMIVTGTYLAPGGATITDITGTTVTMGQAAYPDGIYEQVGTSTLEPNFRLVGWKYKSYQHYGNKLISGFTPSVGDILVSRHSPFSRKIDVKTVGYDSRFGATLIHTNTYSAFNSYSTITSGDNLNISYNDRGRFQATFYRERVFTSQTYTFTAPNNEYTFRTDVGLPYGSFPGVGLTQ